MCSLNKMIENNIFCNTFNNNYIVYSAQLKLTCN